MIIGRSSFQIGGTATCIASVADQRFSEEVTERQRVKFEFEE